MHVISLNLLSSLDLSALDFFPMLNWHILLYLHVYQGHIIQLLFLISNSNCSFRSVQSLSCVWLCDPMDCSMPGFPVHHQLPEPTQTQVHQVSDAMQPSHPLLSPSPLDFNLSHHQGFFQWVSSLPQVCPLQVFLKSHAIKRHLLIGRKAMTNLDSILKRRDITLRTNVCLVKATVFPVVMYGCESWTIKKAECRRIDAFEL